MNLWVFYMITMTFFFLVGRHFIHLILKSRLNKLCISTSIFPMLNVTYALFLSPNYAPNHLSHVLWLPNTLWEEEITNLTIFERIQIQLDNHLIYMLYLQSEAQYKIMSCNYFGKCSRDTRNTSFTVSYYDFLFLVVSLYTVIRVLIIWRISPLLSEHNLLCLVKSVNTTCHWFLTFCIN